MKNNTDKDLYYRRRAEDFEAYTLIAVIVGVILFIPLDGVLCSIVGEENGRLLASIAALYAPTAYFGLRYLYYDFKSKTADPYK